MVTGVNSAFPNDPAETHGTNCAGIVGMEKSNDDCGVGVAYNAHITGRIL